MKFIFSCAWKLVGANDNAAFIPEQWAQETLMILESQMVMARLVHRDFSNEVAKFGDIVNTRQPASFVAENKTDADPVTVQDAVVTNVQVPMNQHIHTSFLIKDGEETQSFESLRDFYLVPAAESVAQSVDLTIIGQMYQFLESSTGALGTAATSASIVNVDKKLNTNKVPVKNRRLVITPTIQAAFLNQELFVSAEKADSDGALREANLGKLFGFDIYMSQNAPSIATGNSTTVGAVNLTAGYVAGDTSIVTDVFSGALTAGSWCTIAGDMTPQKITAATGSPTTLITIWPGLQSTVANNAAITVYDPGAINLSAGYAVPYVKELTVDGFTVAPREGQLTTLAAPSTAAIYASKASANAPSTTAIKLDRPVAADVSNDDPVGIGPPGEYAFGFHKNAIALVSRPLAQPAEGTGALSYVANHGGLTIRVTITYRGLEQGHLVTIDILCGVKVLNTAMGCLLYASS